ncbi:hypothetical protein SAMN05216224_10834 [Thioclava dalianensis]|nr:hypothetical protein SAMN05216224_10834 [Thioclava dalianensis]
MSVRCFDIPRAQAMKPARLAGLARVTGVVGLLDRRALSIPTGPVRDGLRAVAGGGYGRSSPAPYSHSVLGSSHEHRIGAALGSSSSSFQSRATEPRRSGQSAEHPPVGARAGVTSPELCIGGV